MLTITTNVVSLPFLKISERIFSKKRPNLAVKDGGEQANGGKRCLIKCTPDHRVLVLHLWLGITPVAIFFDITITVGTSRLTLGWYFGRFGTLISSSTMMFVV